ncbi:hypothetical protein ACFQY7_48690 [Actinomadura luteofluorescens]|uniref:hypothetical protein n=1 Tax=Actinomadura luteofluorescens TaxID=46163 RepID=UPI0036428874
MLDGLQAGEVAQLGQRVPGGLRGVERGRDVLLADDERGARLAGLQPGPRGGDDLVGEVRREAGVAERLRRRGRGQQRARPPRSPGGCRGRRGRPARGGTARRGPPP